MKIVVIDFETANDHPSSACAIGITEIHDGKIISTEAHIIEPPTDIFRRSFTRIHGLKWEDCKGKPTFKDFYSENISRFENADFLAAHNAGFDRTVLFSTLLHFGIRPPETPFINTLPIARKVLGIKSAPLDKVAKLLDVELNHHEAASDSKACAEIIVYALTNGFDISSAIMKTTIIEKPDKPPTWADHPEEMKEKYLYPWREFFIENGYLDRSYSDFQFRIRGFELNEAKGKEVDFTVEEILADQWVQELISKLKEQ